MPNKVVSELQERLAHLRGKAQALDAKRRAALKDMRRSVEELRRLGDTYTRIRQNGLAPPAPRRDNRALALSERYGLSLRELEVTLLLAEGRSNLEIASVVKLSTPTAPPHPTRARQAGRSQPLARRGPGQRFSGPAATIRATGARASCSRAGPRS